MMRNNFVDFLDRKRLAPSSQKTYSALIKKLCDENPGIENYQYRDIIQLIGKIQQNHSGTSYPHSNLAALKYYFNFLIQEGVRENHPCLTMRLRSSVSKGVVLTDLFKMNELYSLLTRTERYSYLDTRNKIIISLLIYQAASPDEITKILYSDIDMENGLILLRGTRNINRRSLKLTPNQLDYFDSYFTEQLSRFNDKNNKFFVKQSGNGITTDDIHHIISTAKHRFPNKKLNPSRIRQSVIAFWLNEKQIPLEQVQLIAGQKWISTTQRYYFPDFESDRNILKKIHPLG